MKTQSAIYQEITDLMISILKDLKENPELYQRPWIVSENQLGAHNAITKYKYRSFNQLFLSYKCVRYNYSLNRWLTFKQVNKLGGKIKKGEHCSIIYFSSYIEDKNKTEKEESQEETSSKSYHFYLTYYTVFNVAQTEGLPEVYYKPYTAEKPELMPNQMASLIVENCGAYVHYLEGAKAFYRPSEDKIVLPLKSQFRQTDGYYCVLFHEIGHSTGHPERLNRKLFNFFGTEDYAREELTAEMASVFICNHIGISKTMRESNDLM